MSDLYNARMTYCSAAYGNMIYELRKSYGFSSSGLYGGCIFNCYKKKAKGRWEYIMEILVNGNEIKCFKFDSSFDNPVYRTLRNRFNISHNNPFNMEDCIGRFIYLTIDNILTKYNTPFSVVKKAMIFSEIQMETMCDMFDLMLEQSSDDNEGG